MLDNLRRPSFVLFLVLFCFIPADSFADMPRRHRFTHLSVEDGLAHSTVWRVHQDRRGFLWFATAGGLNRYDGSRFELYLHDPEDPHSLSESIVVHILEDRQGDLWFGTRGRGVNRFDPTTERFQRFEEDPEDSNSLLGQEVWAQMEDRSGNLWFGTEAGLSRLDRETGTFTRFQHNSDDPQSLGRGIIWKLLEDHQGILWIGADQGLTRFDPETHLFQRYEHDPDDPRSLPHHNIEALLEDRQQRLWVGTDRGLALLDRENDAFPLVYQNEPNDSATLVYDDICILYESRQGDLWIGTYDGLSRMSYGETLDDSVFTQMRYNDEDRTSLSSDEILDIHEDRSGILWVATRGGLNRYNPHWDQFSVWTPADGLLGDLVNSVTQDENGVTWVATREGVSALDVEQGAIVARYPVGEAGIPDYTVEVALPDHAGELWVGTDGGGLTRLAVNRRDVVQYLPDPEEPSSLVSEFVYFLMEDRSLNLWVGVADGITRFNKMRNKSVSFRHEPEDPQSLSSGAVYNIYEDPQGDFWVATFGGLNYLPREELETGKFVRYIRDPNRIDSLSSNNVTEVVEDSSGKIWVGTTNGLNRLDSSPGETPGRFRRFWRRDGLPHDKVVGIAEADDGSLWIATANGLSRFDPSTENFRNYDSGDGLHGNVFFLNAVHRNSEGDILMGGQGGLTIFSPEEVIDDLQPPGVRLTSFLLFNEKVLPQDRDPLSPLPGPIGEISQLNLKHRHKIVGFEFAALHFSEPLKNRFAYRLDGFQERWIEVSSDRPVAHYTNLDAGTYTFRVKASNKDGVWNEDGASLEIVVAPPPWRSGWAYLLYTLVAAALFFVYFRSHHRKLQQERQMVERERAINRQLREIDKRKDELVAEKISQIKILEGILPICMMCKKIRDDEGDWNQLEAYIDRHSEANFSHGVCPDCLGDLQAKES